VFVILFWVGKPSVRMCVLGEPCDTPEEYAIVEKAICYSDTECAGELGDMPSSIFLIVGSPFGYLMNSN